MFKNALKAFQRTRSQFNFVKLKSFVGELVDVYGLSKVFLDAGKRRLADGSPSLQDGAEVDEMPSGAVALLARRPRLIAAFLNSRQVLTFL